MSSALKDVIGLLQLDAIDDLLFQGLSHDIGSNRVFGGQIVGQALAAAQQTVTQEQTAHSLHAYFLRAGDVDRPVVYQVERARDGQSYANRRIVALQRGRPILNMAASFHLHEEGLSHQSSAPDVPGPDGLTDTFDLHQSVADQVPEKMQRLLAHQRPFEFRPVETPKFMDPSARNPVKHIWMRAWDRLPDDPALHQSLLAYVSDYELLGTATLPHELDFIQRTVQLASLDHALWFHRPFRVDEWLLYACDSPTSSGGRGFVRGQIFNQQGVLVASVAQEGVMRPWRGHTARKG
ncbi:MAG TPA: acyl-CoA thioesterase II [Wenzhouxiangella sp.]